MAFMTMAPFGASYGYGLCIDTAPLLVAIYLDAASCAECGVGKIAFIRPNLSLL